MLIVFFNKITQWLLYLSYAISASPVGLLPYVSIFSKSPSFTFLIIFTILNLRRIKFDTKFPRYFIFLAIYLVFAFTYLIKTYIVGVSDSGSLNTFIFDIFIPFVQHFFAFIFFSIIYLYINKGKVSDNNIENSIRLSSVIFSVFAIFVCLNSYYYGYSDIDLFILNNPDSENYYFVKIYNYFGTSTSIGPIASLLFAFNFLAPPRNKQGLFFNNLLLLLLFIIILISNSRSALISISLIFLYAVYQNIIGIFFRKKISLNSILIFLTAFLTALSIFVFFEAFVSSTQIQIFDKFINSNGFNTPRFHLYKSIFFQILNNPYGYGYDILRFYPIMGFHHAHNLFLSNLYDLGFFGFFSFMVFWIKILSNFINKMKLSIITKRHSIIGIGIFCISSFHMFFDTMIFRNEFLYLVTLLLIMSYLLGAVNRKF